jgi:hypothetical protein
LANGSEEASAGNSISGDGLKSGKRAAISTNVAVVAGEFQMCRLGDVGPYCSTNVKIDLMETNASEAAKTKQRLRLERQTVAWST